MIVPPGSVTVVGSCNPGRSVVAPANPEIMVLPATSVTVVSFETPVTWPVGRMALTCVPFCVALPYGGLGMTVWPTDFVVRAEGLFEELAVPLLMG